MFTEAADGMVTGALGREYRASLGCVPVFREESVRRSPTGIFRSGTEEGQGKALTAEELITGEMRQEFGGLGQWQNPQGKS